MNDSLTHRRRLCAHKHTACLLLAKAGLTVEKVEFEDRMLCLRLKSMHFIHSSCDQMSSQKVRQTTGGLRVMEENDGIDIGVEIGI